MTRTMYDAIDSGGDDSSDVIPALICDSDEEDASERPNATRSGRTITRRSEIDFSFFCFVLSDKLLFVIYEIVNIVFIASTIT